MAITAHQEAAVENSSAPKSHFEKLLSQIFEHFDDQHLNDVTFKLSNPPALVPAHRLILASASPYFKELFKTEKGLCPQIEITEIDSGAFESIIVFCYSGKTLVTIDNVDSILKGALILQLEAAVCYCADFIIENIADYTLKRVYILESETQCELLSLKIFAYETKSFVKVMQSAEFLDFSFSKLQRLLESDDLYVECEKVAFDAVKRWYEHDDFARKQYLPDLIACLRLIQFDKDFISTNIQSLPGCSGLALEALAWLNCPTDCATLKYTKPRKVQDKLLLAFCLETTSFECGAFFQFNKAENVWQKWIDIEIDINQFQTIFMDDNLIFTGGIREGEIINEVSTWSFNTKTFTKLPSMNAPRSSHSLVILNEELYAIGGEDSYFLKSVEKYTVSNGWKLMTSMSLARCYPGVVALNGKIYVMGGFNGSVLKSVECYDPTTNSWTRCADMNEGHEMPGATVHNGQIFIVGGNNRADDKTVERYDPQKNEWTQICSLNASCWKISCISFDDKLWAVGGLHVGGKYKNYVSVYDEQNDKWIEKEAMPLTGVYYCFTAPKFLCA